MLEELRVRNLAIFEDLTIQLGPGLTVLTGETGAGKSLLVDAIQLLVGARASADVVRFRAKTAFVEGRFALKDPNAEAVRQILQREELLDAEDEVTISREVRSDGRSVGRVNGRLVRVGLLRELGEHLVDVHGQSDHLSLLRPRTQLDLLDRYGGNLPLRQEHERAYAELADAIARLSALRSRARDLERERDLVRFELQEIEGAELSPEEEEELEAERRRLANTEQLLGLAQQALAALGENEHGAPTATELVGMAYKSVLDLARIDEQQLPLAERLAVVSEELDEVCRQLLRYAESLEYDPDRLAGIERRLYQIERLKRKYGSSIAEILEYAAELRKRLEELESEQSEEPAVRERIDTLARHLEALSGKLSAARTSAAQRLEKAVKRELRDLQFRQAEFRIHLVPPRRSPLVLPDGGRLELAPLGAEEALMMISPNPGEPAKPLGETASGGETARMMLALKVALAEVDTVPTLIFDEVDQGVGARAGLVVGRKLHQLAQRHQVLCVTHLPQVAAFASRHYRVRKSTVRGRTVAEVTELRGEDRVVELAEMIGTTRPAGLRTARELLASAAS